MHQNVFVVRDPRAIEIIKTGDPDALNAYVVEHPEVDFGKDEFFFTTEEAMGFCRGLKFGIDPQSGVEPYPLREWEEAENLFRKLIKRPGSLDKIRAHQKELEDEKKSGRLFAVYGLTDPDMGAAAVENQYEDFRELVMNGEAGRIFKFISKTRDQAEEYVESMAREYGATILCDYFDKDEPYVKLLEEKKCYLLEWDESQDSEDEDD